MTTKTTTTTTTIRMTRDANPNAPWSEVPAGTTAMTLYPATERHGLYLVTLEGAEGWPMSEGGRDSLIASGIPAEGLPPMGEGCWNVTAEPFQKYDPNESEQSEATTPESEVDETQALIEALRAEVQEAREAAALAKARHRADIDLLSDELIQQAEDRGWCGTYDEVISNVNSRLNRPLRERLVTYEVELEVTYHVTVNVEYSSTAEPDSHDLKELAEGNLNYADLRYEDPYEVEVLDYTEA